MAMSTILSHVKFTKLCRLLNLPRPLILGHMEMLTIYAINHAWTGDLHLTDKDVEAVVDWTGETGAFVAAMVEVRFLERLAPGASSQAGYRIHDWVDWCPRHIKKRIQYHADKEDTQEKPPPVTPRRQPSSSAKKCAVRPRCDTKGHDGPKCGVERNGKEGNGRTPPPTSSTQAENGNPRPSIPSDPGEEEESNKWHRALQRVLASHLSFWAPLAKRLASRYGPQAACLAAMLVRDSVAEWTPQAEGKFYNLLDDELRFQPYVDQAVASIEPRLRKGVN